MKITDSAMKITLQLAVVAACILFTLPARAGAAGGMPSPFFPPYPDYGCDARCILRHEAEFLRCRTATARRLVHHAAARCWTPD